MAAPSTLRERRNWAKAARVRTYKNIFGVVTQLPEKWKSQSDKQIITRIARQKSFLAAYSQAGSIREACEAVGVSRLVYNHWLSNDEEFQLAHEQTMEHVADVLEREAFRRGVEGVDEPVYQGGLLVGTVRKYSDRMLELLLKANAPLKFKDRVSTELTGGGGVGAAVIEIHHNVTRETLKDQPTLLADSNSRMGDEEEDNLHGGGDGVGEDLFRTKMGLADSEELTAG